MQVKILMRYSYEPSEWLKWKKNYTKCRHESKAPGLLSKTVNGFNHLDNSLAFFTGGNACMSSSSKYVLKRNAIHWIWKKHVSEGM